MINWLHIKMQSSTKVLTLVLFLLCSQLSLSAHAHSDTDVGLAGCSVCLVGQNAEFDDALFSNTSTTQLIGAYETPYQYLSPRLVFDKSPLVIYLRGPPA